jgi:hypothetical protein
MYLGVVAGLIDGRHHKRLGAAWMLFEWAIMRQTGQGNEGIVCRGATITYQQVASEMNCSTANVRKWMQRLIVQRYVRIDRERYGFRLFILNPKKFRVSKFGQSDPLQSVQNRTARVSTRGRSKQTHTVEKTVTSQNPLQNNLTKHLKNNNTTALAKIARSVLPSVPEEQRQTQEQSQERKKLLLEQKQSIETEQRLAREQAQANREFEKLMLQLKLRPAQAEGAGDIPGVLT